jgi:23S rRNA G2445 N2-methylase RlmL
MHPILARPQTLALYGPPGGLAEVALEAKAILADPWKPHKFAASIVPARGYIRVWHIAWEQAQELAARLSTIHDARLILGEGKIRDWQDVEATLERQPWSALLPKNAVIDLHSDAGAGVCAHAGKLWQLGADVLTEHGYRGATEATISEAVRIDLVTYQDNFRIAVSLGNDALHKRGWRARAASLATLREDLAAVALRRALELEPRLAETSQVLVPLAGSGTLGFEAWHALAGLPPAIWGTERPWLWLCAPSEAAASWWPRRIQRAAQAVLLPALTFIERDERQAVELRQNIAEAEAILSANQIVTPTIRVEVGDVLALSPKSLLAPNQVTLLPLHPPYGLRLAQNSDLEAFYGRLGRWVGEMLSACDENTILAGFCLCPSEALWYAFMQGIQDVRPDAALATSHLTQGGLDVRLCVFSSIEDWE